MMNEHAQYHIKVKGHLNLRWQAWFDDLNIVLTHDGHTVISGDIMDQAALYGVLKKIRNLGLTLISVNPKGDNDDDKKRKYEPQ